MSDITIRVQDDATGSIVIDGAHEPILEPDVASARAAAMRRAVEHARATGRTVTVTAHDPTATFHLGIQPDGSITTQPTPAAPSWEQPATEPGISEIPDAQEDLEATRPRAIAADAPAAPADTSTQGGAPSRTPATWHPVADHHGQASPELVTVGAPGRSALRQQPGSGQRLMLDEASRVPPMPGLGETGTPPSPASADVSDPVDADPRWAGISQEPATHGFRGTLNGMGLKLAPTDEELAERREALRQEIAREEEARRADEQLAQEEAVQETRRAARERAAAERDRAERAIIQTNYEEPKTVGFMNDKGGVGKTTDALCIAAAAGRIRGGDVIAWDANETRGTMGFRALKDRHSRSVVDFLDEAAEDFRTVEGSRRTTLSRYTRGQGDNQFAVLASDESRKKQDQVNGDAFRTVHEIVGRFHSLIIVDTGNNHEVSHFKAALAATDQLVVPVSPGEDGAYAAELMLDNFIAWGYGDLVKNAVVLLHDSATQHGDARAIAAKFENRVRAILPIPFDKILDAGGEIDFDALAPATRAAYQTAAAAISHGLADTKEE